jgi:hypothetical protein
MVCFLESHLFFQTEYQTLNTEHLFEKDFPKKRTVLFDTCDDNNSREPLQIKTGAVTFTLGRVKVTFIDPNLF